MVVKLSALYSDRIAISVIFSEEFSPVTAPAVNRCSCKSDKSVYHILVVNFLAILDAVKIGMDHLTHSVLHKYCLCNILWILQIHLILLIVAVVCKLSVACNIKASCLIRIIRHAQIPHFVCLVQWNIISYFWMNTAVISHHLCVCCSMMTLTLVFIQILSYRLPRSWPVILAAVVSDINISARLIELIKHISQKPSVCTWLCKAVSTCIIGNNCSILRWSKIVYPWCRCVRSCNNIFFFWFIKISVFHKNLLTDIYK